MLSDRDPPECKFLTNSYYRLKHAIDEMKLVSSFEKGKVNPEASVQLDGLWL